MKHILLVLSFVALSLGTFAADGYSIKLNFSDLTDSKVFLAHYYGKPLPTIYKIDSASVDKNGQATLSSDHEIIGGIYLVILDGNTNYFEFLLDNGDKLDISLSKDKLPLGVKFKNNPENEQFLEYAKYLSNVAQLHQQYIKDLAKAKTSKDTAAIQQKVSSMTKDVIAYRNNYISKHPKTLLASIFNAMKTPDVPQGTHYLPDGSVDSTFGYKYYKEHYWDNFDFTDDRLTYTPIYENKLEEYFDRLVVSIPDSVIKEADELIAKTRKSKEIFKYTLHWLAKYTQESNIMGMDAVFVHIVEQYYMKGDAFWLNQGTLEKYIQRARSIAPNVIGNVGPELNAVGIDGKEHSLHGVDAKYTLLVFWSPDCGHCREIIPKVDSVYKALNLKKKGMKVYAFNVDRETERWEKEIEKDKLNDWIHVYDPERTTGYKAEYDVYGTPVIYLLDEKKIIQGKRLGPENIGVIVDILEQETKEKKS